MSITNLNILGSHTFVLFVVGYARFYHEGHEDHEGSVAQEYVIELIRSCNKVFRC